MTTTVALNLNAATQGLRAEVMRLVADAGLRARRVVLTTGVGSTDPLGPRAVTFSIVDVQVEADDPEHDRKVSEAVAGWIPKDRVAPMQWRVERRLQTLYANVVDLHAAATGIDTWLVVTGDIMPPISPGPLDGQTPPGQAPIAFRQAKAA